MSTPILSSAGLRRFQEIAPEAVDSVTRRFFAEHGDLYAKLGPRGRAACHEDLAFHLEFLRPVLEFGIIAPMVEYLRWLASVLATRGIPSGHLTLSLDMLAEFFAATMEGPDAKITVRAMQRIKERFLETDKAPSGAYGMMPERWPECDAFEDALLRGDRSGAGSLLDHTYASGHTLVDAEMHIIQPALYDIGKRWQENQVTVAQEHLATAIAGSLMIKGLLGSDVPPANGRKVVLACVAGNMHVLGLQMVADAFQLSGWEVQFLGANMPTEALIKHVGEQTPELLGLSVSFPQQLRVVKDVMGRLRETFGAARPRVIVGGLAINQFDRLADQLGSDAWRPDARSAVTFASSLTAQPSH